ncbi:MAG: TetR/AcrR family transcriptional regulator [Calditrichaeota bacterium]|nr:TetR/AcrR family transcriptional regulator [Calditrichota bacterium]
MNYSERQIQIINTAISLIAEKGIQELTIKNISKKIGIVESAIYRHFASKQDILLGILTLFKENKDQILQSVQGTASGASEQLKAFFTKRFEQFSNNPAFASVIFSEDFFRNDKRLSEMVYQIMQETQQLIIEIIKAGQQQKELRDDVPADQLAAILTGTLRLIVTRWRLSEFSFDLQSEGQKLWQTIEKLIKE